jgi:hypothetical protein
MPSIAPDQHRLAGFKLGLNRPSCHPRALAHSVGRQRIPADGQIQAPPTNKGNTLKPGPAGVGSPPGPEKTSPSGYPSQVDAGILGPMDDGYYWVTFFGTVVASAAKGNGDGHR